MDDLPAIKRPRKRGLHTKRQLAIVAWMHCNMPPGLRGYEIAMIYGKLTHMMSPDEERQVMAFMKDKPAMLKALKTGTPLKLVK